MPLDGAFQIDLEKLTDTRGFFARLFCTKEFAALGLASEWAQCNTSYNKVKGTLRGLHFQRPPMAEAKVVRCLKGGIFDVIVDLRAGSSSFGEWASIELTEDNRTMVYIPPGFGHGFQTIASNTEILYFHSKPYSPADEGGLRFDDPKLKVTWPLPVANLSPRDGTHPYLEALKPIAI